MGKTVFITGIGSGLGKVCAECFAQAGYDVFGIARSVQDGKVTLDNGVTYTVFRGDVNDDASVADTVMRAAAKNGTIHVVLHCAGFGIAGAAEDTPAEAAKQQMETNYFGVLRVNRILLPYMRRAGGGTVLITSSVAARLPIPFQSHYSSSKYALEAYAQCLRMESARYGIRVCVIEPGDTKTGFTFARKNAVPQDSVYRESCTKSVARMAADEQNGDDPKKFARICLKAAKAKNPPPRKTVGFQYKLFVFLARLLPDRFVLYVLTKMYNP